MTSKPKKPKRVVLGNGYCYYFYKGSRCIRIEPGNYTMEYFKNIKKVAGKKIRLIAEVLE